MSAEHAHPWSDPCSEWCPAHDPYEFADDADANNDLRGRPSPDSAPHDDLCATTYGMDCDTMPGCSTSAPEREQ